MKKIAGHTLLARLGKKRLRPGGIKATKWLLSNSSLNDKKLLEVACNMGTTSIELAKKYSIDITAIDLDDSALETAKKNAEGKNVIDKINFIKADALALPFDDKSFDVVLNEAMLTMLSDENKLKATSEYNRVLKDGGLLLTHDVCLRTDDEEKQKEIIMNLSRAINIHAVPKTVSKWQALFEDNGFTDIKVLHGPMSLLNPVGMIRDEGFINTLRIIKNSRKKENKEQFKLMYKTFKKYKNELGFVAFICKKA